MVQDRLNAAKPQPPAVDPKAARAAINNNRDLDVEAKKDEPSFFGSFFSAKNGVKKRPAGSGPQPSVMEAPPAVIKPQMALNERETMETEVISACLNSLIMLVHGLTDWFSISTELLIHSYFNIVKREMIDMVPKAISLTLVGHSKENLQRELLQELYKPDVLDDLLKESEYVVSRRKEVLSMVQALNKAEE